MKSNERERGADGNDELLRSAGARVQRSGAGLYYVLTDHLGSASVTLDSTGAVLGEQRYYPFGATRAATGTRPTDRLFTGQRDLEGLGLYHYNARAYSSALGRFISADTVVPQPGNPQALNRYSYVLGSPTMRTDPSGHDPLDQEWLGWFSQNYGVAPSAEASAIRLFSLAYPNEFRQLGGWNYFLDSKGRLRLSPDGKASRFSAAFRDTSHAARDWAHMSDALENLAGAYKPWESALYARDIGTLFGGLPNRLHYPDSIALVKQQVTPNVWLRGDGIPSYFNSGLDGDGNVHHWAAFFAIGYSASDVLPPFGGWFAGAAINEYREKQQAVSAGYLAADDVALGNWGAYMGEALNRMKILTPGTVRLWYSLTMSPFK